MEIRLPAAVRITRRCIYKVPGEWHQLLKQLWLAELERRYLVRVGGVQAEVRCPARAGVCASKVSMPGRDGNHSSSSLPDWDRSERGQGQRRTGSRGSHPHSRRRMGAEGGSRASGRRWKWPLLCDAGHTNTVKPHSMTTFVSLCKFSR